MKSFTTPEMSRSLGPSSLAKISFAFAGTWSGRSWGHGKGRGLDSRLSMDDLPSFSHVFPGILHCMSVSYINIINIIINIIIIIRWWWYHLFPTCQMTCTSSNKVVFMSAFCLGSNHCEGVSLEAKVNEKLDVPYVPHEAQHRSLHL